MNLTFLVATKGEIDYSIESLNYFVAFSLSVISNKYSLIIWFRLKNQFYESIDKSTPSFSTHQIKKLPKTKNSKHVQVTAKNEEEDDVCEQMDRCRSRLA